MNFTELNPGTRIPGGTYTVSEEELLSFARQYDPQWFHIDKSSAQEGPFGALIASGWHTCAIAMRLAVGAVLASSGASVSPGCNRVQWLEPVKAGDTLRFEATVLERRVSTKNPSTGVVVWEWQLVNQHGRAVLVIETVTLFGLPAA